MNRFYGCALAALVGGVSFAAPATPAETRPAEGIREKTPQFHALVGARIVVAPGNIIARGTVIIRDGGIEAVGADVAVPGAARVWDHTGHTIYAGFIDAYQSKSNIPVAGDTGYWNSQVRPQARVLDHFKSDADQNEKLRSQGITARLVAPSDGVIAGTSALVSTADVPMADAVIHDGVALHMRLTVGHQHGRQSYPSSPMGAVALARQAMYDAQWYRQAWRMFQSDPGLPRPEHNSALAALGTWCDEGRTVILDAPDEQYVLRADRFAREFGIPIAIRGSGHEYRRIEAIARLNRAVIVPLAFPQPPDVGTHERARHVTLEQLMHWDLAPENPARLAQHGIKIAFTTDGLKQPSDFLKQLRRSVHRGLSPDDCLRGLTVHPAEICGVTDQLGQVRAGTRAHLVITDGDLFQKESQILETWIDGRRYEVSTQPPFDARGTWQGALTGPGPATTLTLKISGKTTHRLEGVALLPPPPETAQPDQPNAPNQPDPNPPDPNKGSDGNATEQNKDNENKKDHANDKDKKSEKEVALDRLELQTDRWAGTFRGDAFGVSGVARISALLTRDATGVLFAQGTVCWPDGRCQGWRAPHAPINATADATTGTPSPPAEKSSSSESPSDQAKDGPEKEKEEKAPEPVDPLYDTNYPLGAYGRKAPPVAPARVAFEGATMWTCGPAGIMENATLLVEHGRIVAAGSQLEIPADTQRIDLKGKHLTPGIIDCHSHMATDGGINEATQAITAEVRIGDFIDATDISIYRQLAGGVTCANILHGSANPIGGQNQVIKLRWGALPEEMKFAQAPAGIKFALGENVKQSNWGDEFTTRYPQTRMGVEQLIRDALQGAREYRQRHLTWQQMRVGLPPRRDLELEALVEVLAGTRWIHCHSYRQDEIVALLKVLDEYGIRIGTLQHILEGYKVAEVLAQHGAMASSFSDWWAFKFEVYDAIPYNGALMHQAGVVVSFNSDDAELGRHLNHEAAKAMKYGGIPVEEALKFVTLNPARQLRIDHLVGSLEPGKDADLAIWSGPPLSLSSVCEQTWIDGRPYFDRSGDRQAREEIEAMRNALIQRILQSKEPMLPPGEGEPRPSQLWPREDTFCAHGDSAQ